MSRYAKKKRISNKRKCCIVPDLTIGDFSPVITEQTNTNIIKYGKSILSAMYIGSHSHVSVVHPVLYNACRITGICCLAPAKMFD